MSVCTHTYRNLLEHQTKLHKLWLATCVEQPTSTRQYTCWQRLAGWCHFFAGATATKVLRVFQHMKVAITSHSTFQDHQRQYLQPVVEHVWARHQSSTGEELSANADHPLNICGDGRADIP